MSLVPFAACCSSCMRSYVSLGHTIAGPSLTGHFTVHRMSHTLFLEGRKFTQRVATGNIFIYSTGESRHGFLWRRLRRRDRNFGPRIRDQRE